jgi:hypothetical protein
MDTKLQSHRGQSGSSMIDEVLKRRLSVEAKPVLEGESGNSFEVPGVCTENVRIKQEHGLSLVHFKESRGMFFAV